LRKDEVELNEARWTSVPGYGVPVHLRLWPDQKIPVKRQAHLTQEGWKRACWRLGQVLKKHAPMKTVRLRGVRNWDSSEGLGLSFEEPTKPGQKKLVQKGRVLAHWKQVPEEQVRNLRELTTGCSQVPN
jgi:hypothetical protein